MFDADRPILKSEQDRLGRAIFAKYLARCILDHKSPESLVIGLYGGWGSGKTSIINLALEELRFASSNMVDAERPIILNFSPWSYSGQDALIYSFFRRLSAEMRTASYFEDSEDIVALLELYISFFTQKPIPPVFRQHSWLDKLWHPGRVKASYVGWESGRDLTLVKAELNQKLSQKKHKIIIFIDNIARLKDEEIRQMFQMIKSIGDFANTVYVLALDKTYVVNVMNRLHDQQGEHYLEKLVQLPFDVPAIAKQDIESILLDRLNQIVVTIPAESWNRHDWADIYYGSLKYFFDNCRDITRYINTLSFSFSFVKDLVNPVDFFAITALEVFEPAVFAGVRDNKDLFADLAEHVAHFDAKKLAEDKIRCDEILQRAVMMPQDRLLQLLLRLFPRLRQMYQAKQHYFHSEAIARKHNRICTYDRFDTYFRFSIATNAFTDEELSAILTLTEDEKGLALALLRLNQDERIPKLLDALDGLALATIKQETIPNVINALMDSADLFPQGEATALRFDTPMRVHRIIHQLLRRYDNDEQRYHILSDAIQKAIYSIHTSVYEVMLQGDQHREESDTFVPDGQQDVNPLQLRQLQRLAVEKIQQWAANGRLIEHPQLIDLLRAWKLWGDEGQCQQFVLDSMASDRGVVAFLLAALRIPVNEALKKEVKNPAWRSHLKNIEDFIPHEKIIPRAEELFSNNYFEKLRETEQLALLIYLDLVKPGSAKMIPKVTGQ